MDIGAVGGGRDVVVFDVNETLLDVQGLLSRFEEVLPGELMSLWFSRMLHGSLVASATGVYVPFSSHGVAALISTGAGLGLEVSEEQADWVVAGMAQLPAHPDVPPALKLLKGLGFRLATLTNSSSEVLSRQIANAGLTDYFERLISIDDVATFKPFPQTYRHAAAQLGVPVGAIRLVAAHDWDVTGALRAGAKAAFVDRKGRGLSGLSETPDIVGPDLVAVATAIAASK